MLLGCSPVWLFCYLCKGFFVVFSCRQLHKLLQYQCTDVFGGQIFYLCDKYQGWLLSHVTIILVLQERVKLLSKSPHQCAFLLVASEQAHQSPLSTPTGNVNFLHFSFLLESYIAILFHCFICSSILIFAKKFFADLIFPGSHFLIY